MSETDSIALYEDQSMHINPARALHPVKTNNKLFQTGSTNVPTAINRCANVLSLNKITGKLVVNEEFEQYLAEDATNPDAIIVSFLGEAKIGKSFLVDSLLTYEYNKVTRIMSRSTEKPVNSPTIITKNRGQQDRLIYLDCSGNPSNEIFLWCYFLSSALVYNITGTGGEERERLVQLLSFVQSHLDMADREDLSLPQLVLVRRDGEGEWADRETTGILQRSGLFQGVQLINMPYPGVDNIPSKQLLDVPLKQISQAYISQVDALLRLLKSSKAKILKGSFLSTKIASLALEQVTRAINRDRRVDVDKVWAELVESLSVGFYNYYLKLYEEQLLREFQEQKPCDKYTLYKRLSSMRRRVDKKVEGFKALQDDATFMRYKQKLDDTIRSKQSLITKVNQSKSAEENDKHCKRLFKELDDRNSLELLDQYCKSELDDQKAEVLLGNIQNILEQKSRLLKKSKSGKGSNDLERQIDTLEKQIQAMELRLVKQTAMLNSKPEYNFQEKKRAIAEKQNKARQITEQLNVSKAAIKKILDESKQNQQLLKLQEQCQNLKQKIQKNEYEMNELRNQREQEIKRITKELDARLKAEEQAEKQLLERLKRLREKPESPDKKKGTCCCTIM